MKIFLNILLGILVLQTIAMGTEKKYDKKIEFATLIFNNNKIEKNSKSELDSIVSEIKRYRHNAKK